MKKSLCIFILTAAAGLCSVLSVFWAVDGEKGNIAVTETVLAGEASAAEGISVEIGTHWKGKLLWNTVYQPGHAQEAVSSFNFSGQGTVWSDSVPRGWGGETENVVLNVEPDNFGTVYTDSRNPNIVMEGMPWHKVLQAAADRTAAGETRTVTLRVRDYYDYYPVEMYAVFKGNSGYFPIYSQDEEFTTEFFGLLIPEDEEFLVTVSKDPDGEILDLKCRSAGKGYYPVTTAVLGDKGYWFSFYLQGDKDSEELPGEFGGKYAVYWLPSTADYEEMKAAVQLPEGVIPVAMRLDGEGRFLYLLALQKGQYILLTYSADEENLTLLQQLPIYDTASDLDVKQGDAGYAAHFRKMTVQNDGILFTWENRRFVFVARDGEECRFWCTGIFPAAETAGETIPLSPGAYSGDEAAFPYEHGFAFDGTRLALVAFENWISLDSRLVVYKEGRLVYSGYYQYSGELDRELGMSDRILPWGSSYAGLRRDGAEVPLKVQAAALSQPAP